MGRGCVVVRVATLLVAATCLALGVAVTGPSQADVGRVNGSATVAGQTQDRVTAAATTYRIRLGQTFRYTRCWNGKAGQRAVLQVAQGEWATVASTKLRRSSNCPRKYPFATKYSWTPRYADTYRMREVIRPAGSWTGGKRPFYLVVSRSSATPTPTPSPSPSSPLQGCYFNGKALKGTVYYTSFEWEADVRIYVTGSWSGADLRVYHTSTSASAFSCGQWYPSNLAAGALRVYVTRYPGDADITVHYVDSSVFAGLG